MKGQSVFRSKEPAMELWRDEGERGGPLAENGLVDFLAAMSSAGFSGITVDTFGYAGNGADMEAHLAAKLSARPLVSPDKRCLFFSLEAYAMTHSAR